MASLRAILLGIISCRRPSTAESRAETRCGTHSLDANLVALHPEGTLRGANCCWRNSRLQEEGESEFNRTLPLPPSPLIVVTIILSFVGGINHSTLNYQVPIFPIERQLFRYHSFPLRVPTTVQECVHDCQSPKALPSYRWQCPWSGWWCLRGIKRWVIDRKMRVSPSTPSRFSSYEPRGRRRWCFPRGDDKRPPRGVGGLVLPLAVLARRIPLFSGAEEESWWPMKSLACGSPWREVEGRPSQWFKQMLPRVFHGWLLSQEEDDLFLFPRE